MKFKRSLGWGSLLFAAIGGMLGSAWLFSPLYAAQLAGPGAVLAWIIGGGLMLVLAMTFAELVSMLPVSGGNARFAFLSHGPLAGFMFSWIVWLSYSAVAPIETMGILQYLASIAPWLVHAKAGITVLTFWGYCVAAGILLLLCILNFFSVKWLSRYNSLTVWIKMIVPLLVAVVFIVVAFHASNFSSHHFLPSGFHGIAHAISAGGIIFAFAGYAPAIVLAGEAKNPKKVIPFVLIGAILICALFYVVIQIGFIGALPIKLLSHGWSHLHFAHDTASPFLALANHVGVHWLGVLILITAVVAPFGTALIFITSSSRVVHAMSETGYFPKFLSILSHRGVPIWAVLVNFVVGIILFFPSPGWQGMVGFLVSAFVLSYVVGPVSLLSFRKQLPNTKRSFKLPFVYAWCFVSLLIASCILYWAGWHIEKEMLIAILLGVVVLSVMHHKNHQNLEWRSSVWVFVYLIGLGLVSKMGHFGGLDVLSQFQAYICLALLSLVTLFIALKIQSLPKVVAERAESSLAKQDGFKGL